MRRPTAASAASAPRRAPDCTSSKCAVASRAAREQVREGRRRGRHVRRHTRASSRCLASRQVRQGAGRRRRVQERHERDPVQRVHRPYCRPPSATVADGMCTQFTVGDRERALRSHAPPTSTSRLREQRVRGRHVDDEGTCKSYLADGAACDATKRRLSVPGEMPERKVRHTRSDDLQVRVPAAVARSFRRRRCRRRRHGRALAWRCTKAVERNAGRCCSPSTPSGLPRSARRATPNPCLEVFTKKDAEALSIPSFEITADDDTENKCGVFAIAKRPEHRRRRFVSSSSEPAARRNAGDR